MEITLVRHAETTANAARLLQGHGESGLSEMGVAQAEVLAARIDMGDFALVITSDLDRAVETAEALGGTYEMSSEWRELDIGTWEGKSWNEIRVEFADDLELIRAGRPVSFGGGESLDGFADRVRRALSRLFARLSEGDRALVITHGGVINQVVKAVCDLPVHSRYWGRSANTSLTRLVHGTNGWALATFNDAAHLGPTTPYVEERVASGDRAVFLIRHGQTDANLHGRWQGAADQGLNPTGMAQVAALSSLLTLDTVFSSPLLRARETGAALDGATPTSLEGLAELRMGDWEDLTFEQIRELAPERWQSIFVEGEDLPRGRGGETWDETGRRFAEAVVMALAASSGSRIGLVSHGAAIGAYLSRLLEIPHRQRRRLSIVDNASVTTVVHESRGKVVADFNVRPIGA